MSVQVGPEYALSYESINNADMETKPDNEVVVHSDQGSQYTNSEWQ